MSEEIWKDIEGYPGYQVSDLGNVRSFRDYHGNIIAKSHPIKFETDKDGYYKVCLYTLDHKRDINE